MGITQLFLTNLAGFTALQCGALRRLVAHAAAGSLTSINAACLPQAEDGFAVQALLGRQARAIRLMSGEYMVISYRQITLPVASSQASDRSHSAAGARVCVLQQILCTTSYIASSTRQFSFGDNAALSMLLSGRPAIASCTCMRPRAVIEPQQFVQCNLLLGPMPASYFGMGVSTPLQFRNPKRRNIRLFSTCRPSC